jgi:hypothetical protein
MRNKIRGTDVLLVVDVQSGDFCPAGNLAVPFGGEVLPIFDPVGARPVVVHMQVWHPNAHQSFRCCCALLGCTHVTSGSTSTAQ